MPGDTEEASKSYETCDVFISGAGPVGLVLAYHLAQLGQSVVIIDAVDKASSGFPTYGRACMLYPRTLEVLDQLGLHEDLSQVGFSSDRSWGYKDGRPIDRKWGFLDSPESKMHTTFIRNTLNIRLKHSEDIFRRRLEELGTRVRAPFELVDFLLDQDTGEKYRVTASCSNTFGDTLRVKARYIVGCDGGGSAVRRISGIPFLGEKKKQYWVRIDGVVKTDLPEARHGLGAIESSTHGHVVWVSLDHCATRIGYVLSTKLFERYGPLMSVEEAAHEAQKAVAPFKIEFERVDWHTVYEIQQHVADRFQDRERIILAGDAAHTHSSGSAQGMNIGIQDITNLSWRLAGVLRNWYKPAVLDDYSNERRAVALQLIENDKIISCLVGQQKPEHLKHRTEHAHVLLDEFLRQQSGFTTGLGVTYGSSFLNDGAGSNSARNVSPGQRLPDALLQKSGIVNTTSRLYDVTKNNGRFRILVLTGAVRHTGKHLQTLRAQVDSFLKRAIHAIEFVTIIPGSWHAFDEFLGTRRFGTAFWDPDLSSYSAFGVSDTEGALLIVRPDGILALVSALQEFTRLETYFDRVLR